MNTYEIFILHFSVTFTILKNKNMTNIIQKTIQDAPDLLTIGEVADLFKIHRDTLRNMEDIFSQKIQVN